MAPPKGKQPLVIKPPERFHSNYTGKMGRGFSTSTDEITAVMRGDSEDQILYGIHNRQQDSSTDPFDEISASYWAEKNLSAFLSFCADVHAEEIVQTAAQKLQTENKGTIHAAYLNPDKSDERQLVIDYQRNGQAQELDVPWAELLYTKRYSLLLDSLVTHLNNLGIKATEYKRPS